MNLYDIREHIDMEALEIHGRDLVEAVLLGRPSSRDFSDGQIHVVEID